MLILNNNKKGQKNAKLITHLILSFWQVDAQLIFSLDVSLPRMSISFQNYFGF